MSSRIERVLYVNQSAAISGAERSLIDLLELLPGTITPIVATPPGELSAALEERGIAVEALRPLDLSFRLHPIRTPIGVAWIPRSAMRIRRLASANRVQLIHANSARAGFPAVLARKLGGPALIVHVRDHLPEGIAARATLALTERGADLVIANSRYVASQYRDPGSTVRVIHNAIDPTRFDPTRFDRVAARSRLNLGEGPVLAVIGQFTPWKAQDDAVRVLASLKPHYPGIRLLLVGAVKFSDPGGRFDTSAFRSDVAQLARSLDVEDSVVFTGQREDIPELLSAVDVLLVPSWWEPFGRVVIEGMAMQLPVVATNVGGPAEIIRNEVDGILLPPRSPDEWAAAVARVLDDEPYRQALGDEARARVAAHFAPQQLVASVLASYDDALARRGARRSRGDPTTRR